jgi:hypothetical protein
VFSIFSEATFMQKVNYIHMNPVRAEFGDRAIDYRWSSARLWHRCAVDDEPLQIGFGSNRLEKGIAMITRKLRPEGQRPSAHRMAKSLEQVLAQA